MSFQITVNSHCYGEWHLDFCIVWLTFPNESWFVLSFKSVKSLFYAGSWEKLIWIRLTIQFKNKNNNNSINLTYVCTNPVNTQIRTKVSTNLIRLVLRGVIKHIYYCRFLHSTRRKRWKYWLSLSRWQRSNMWKDIVR